MSFEPGHKKVGGRKKGSPNKKTEFLFSELETKKFDVIGNLIDLIPQLSLEKRADTLIQLLPYLYPKRKPSEIQNDPSTNEIKIVVSANDLNL
jgi:hypothetical protein